MIRTQIYLTLEKVKRLKQLSKQTGKSKSELIRGSIDRYLAVQPQVDWKEKNYEERRYLSG